MPRISEQKKQKISEQILHYLFEQSPTPKFTSEIAREIARDEEFMKSMLLSLEKEKLITQVNKSPSGTQYIRRQRWRLSNGAYKIYKNHQ